MRTARSLVYRECGLCSGGVSVQGGFCPRGLCRGGPLSRGVSVQEGSLCPGGLCPRGASVQGVSVQGDVTVREIPCPPVNRMTDSCKNITLP